MKKCLLILTLIIFISCDSDNDTNIPPTNFEVSLSSITKNTANLSWTESTDPENGIIKYDIYLNEMSIAENIVIQNYSFENLKINTVYNGKIIAKDISDNLTEKQFSFTTLSIPCIPNVLQSNLIAFYPFSEGNILDIAYSNDLTNIDAEQTTDRGSNDNCAYLFDSFDDYLTTTNTAFLNNLSEFSISLWFNASTQGFLIHRDEGFHCPDTNGQWSLIMYDLGKPVFGHLNSVWDSTWDYTSDFNTWHHLVATYNVTNNTLSIYRNGVLGETDTGIANCGTTPTVEDIGDLIIGKFKGKLDDIAIFNTELSQSEISLLYNSEPCCE